MFVEDSEESLWREIGRSLEVSTARPRSDEELANDGRSWWSRNKTRLGDALRASPKILGLLNRDPSSIDQVTLSAMVLDALLAASIGVAPAALSVMIVRYGVTKLMEEDDSANRN